jgi:hypothetical protein
MAGVVTVILHLEAHVNKFLVLLSPEKEEMVSFFLLKKERKLVKLSI